MRSGLWTLAISAALANTAQAGFLPGVNPYQNVILTGTFSTNAVLGTSVWGDKTTYSSAYIGAPGPALFYNQEPNPNTDTLNVETVFLDTTDRDVGGSIFVNTAPGGALTTNAGSFNIPLQRFGRVDIGAGGNRHGLRIEANTTTNNNYQIGEAELLLEDPGPNRAFGATTITSGPTGSVTDEQYFGIGSTEWRANPAGDNQFVGFGPAPGETQPIRALRRSSRAPHGAGFRWTNFRVETKQGGTWTPQGFASIPGSTNVYWIDFESSLMLEGVRLFGSNALGNNPTASGGLIIDDIMAFGIIPEPTSFALLATGIAVVAACRRRRGLALEHRR